MTPYKRTALIILDGWGIGPDPSRSALAQAHTPNMDHFMAHFPNSRLVTFGTEVGLPEGQMGNSEVGHLNIGAGRVVYQELERINVAIKTSELQSNQALLNAIEYAKSNNKPLHLLGLLSDGGVHSHINHLLALCDLCEAKGLEKVFIHAFMDGRDTSPKGGAGYLKTLLEHLKGKKIKLASICGRYYAMDRDKRWERVKLAYDLMVKGEGETTNDPIAWIQSSYEAGLTDEFLKPALVEGVDGIIKADDAVLCFNFRTDRCREITEVLTQTDMPELGMKTLPLYYCTMTRYDEKFKNVHVMFEKDDLSETLGETLSVNGKTQLRLAETEKYPHVTFFFNGGREEPFEGERRLIVPSPKVATYDQQPEMNAFIVAYQAMDDIRVNKPDFFCVNFANTDMVGHTGDFEAAKTAANTVDFCLGKLTKVLLENDYAIIIIADHGNSDYMINDDGTPNTAHTTNPVPCIFVANDTQDIKLKDGKLGDVAPTLLALLGLKAPSKMNGISLLA